MTATVAVLSLGGTIFMSQDGEGDNARPDDGAAARLLATLAGDVQLLPETLANTSSSDVRPHHLAAVLDRARAVVDAGADGVVLTHGTDTLEESAFLLERYWDREAPLVVTGAMRPASDVGADGPANLRDAVRTVTAPSARGLGVLVVFDGHAHRADEVTKSSSRSVSAFSSAPTGPLGIVEAHDLHLLQAPRPRVAQIGGTLPDRFPPVPLLIAGLDEDLELLDHVPSAQLAGLLIAGVGMGHVSPAAMPRLRALLEAGTPVVVATRIPSGGTSTHHYAYPGSEVDLLDAGATMAGLLPPQKARLLLQTHLGAARESGAEVTTEGVRELFAPFAS